MIKTETAIITREKMIPLGYSSTGVDGYTYLKKVDEYNQFFLKVTHISTSANEINEVKIKLGRYVTSEKGVKYTNGVKVYSIKSISDIPRIENEQILYCPPLQEHSVLTGIAMCTGASIKMIKCFIRTGCDGDYTKFTILRFNQWYDTIGKR